MQITELTVKIPTHLLDDMEVYKEKLNASIANSSTAKTSLAMAKKKGFGKYDVEDYELEVQVFQDLVKKRMKQYTDAVDAVIASIKYSVENELTKE